MITLAIIPFMRFPCFLFDIKGPLKNNLVEFAPEFAVDLTTPQAWLSKTAGIASYFEANFTKIRCE